MKANLLFTASSVNLIHFPARNSCPSLVFYFACVCPFVRNIID